jgi:uncharacterized protein (TIGR02001 family)
MLCSRRAVRALCLAPALVLLPFAPIAHAKSHVPGDIASAVPDGDGVAGPASALFAASLPDASLPAAALVQAAGDPVDDPQAGDEGGSDFTLTGNLTLASEYRFRGVDLTNGDPALQGGFDLGHVSGLYAGVWASNLDEDTVGYGFIEVDLYGGWSGPVAEGLVADIGFIAYTYPDAGAGNFDYYEVYGNLAFSLGPVSTKVGVAYDPEQDGLDFGGLTRDNLYLYSDLSLGVPDTPVTLNAHLGYTDGSLTFTHDSKSFDWLIGADWAINQRFTASLAYIDAEADVGIGAFNPTSSTLVASISTSF